MTQLNYQYLKGSVESGPVTPMQQEWAEHIIKMIPEHLRNKPDLKEVLKELFMEVHSNFNDSMKKSMGEERAFNLFLCILLQYEWDKYT